MFNTTPFPLNRIQKPAETFKYKDYKYNLDSANKNYTLPTIQPITPINIKPENIVCDDKTKICHIKQ